MIPNYWFYSFFGCLGLFGFACPGLQWFQNMFCLFVSVCLFFGFSSSGGVVVVVEFGQLFLKSSSKKNSPLNNSSFKIFKGELSKDELFEGELLEEELFKGDLFKQELFEEEHFKEELLKHFLKESSS